MSFTAEEIARFDTVLADMYESELRSVIWLMILFLAILIVLPFLPKDKRWRDTPLLDDGEKETRYRNGKKLSRREWEAEQGKRHKRGESIGTAFRAVIWAVMLGLTVMFGVFSWNSLQEMQRDMDEDAYVVHEGEFQYGFSFGGRNSGDRAEITFTDTNGETVAAQIYDPAYGDMEDGLYTGRVVYAKNCGYVIEVEWDSTEP